METQKIVNLLNGSDNDNSRVATKKWYIIDNESLTTSIESSLCDYSDAYILVTGNINVTGGDANTKVAFKNCAPFKDCRTEINDTFVGYASFINIAMPMYNLIEYSDNYSDTSGRLWQLKRDEQPVNNNGGFINLTTEDSSSFKYKSNRIGNLVADGANGKKEGVKIALPLKYLSNFWIDCRIN